MERDMESSFLRCRTDGSRVFTVLLEARLWGQLPLGLLTAPPHQGGTVHSFAGRLSTLRQAHKLSCWTFSPGLGLISTLFSQDSLGSHL